MATVVWPTALKEVFTTALTRGWATCEIPLDAVRRLVQWQANGVLTRRDGPAISILRPQTPEQAHPRSLSAKYGLGALPLHTDGAHLPRPPDLTLLEAPVQTDVPTLLFDLRTARMPDEVEHALTTGVFSVGIGAASFYAHVLDQCGEVRYDPGCMFAVDPTARAVAAWLTNATRSATDHHWQPGETLVIANRRCLHGRPQASASPNRTLRRLMIHWAQL